VTIQHALNQLIRDGFLYTLPRKGTFVVPAPPHLCHYAITFHEQPSEPGGWPQFWAGLSHEAISMQQAGDRRLSLFYGVHGWKRQGDFPRLLDLARRHLLAGIIFTSDPHHLVGMPLFTEPGIPRVAITPGTYPGVTSVMLDTESLWGRLADAVCVGSRRRMGLVTTPGYPNAELRAFIEGRGIEMRPEWMLAVHVEDAEWACNAARSIVQGDRRRRPEVVFIADDNLVPHATAGLAASGLRVPDDLEVIAHCNLPWPTTSSVPARRLGYDVRRVLKTCMDLIDQMRAERAVPAQVVVPAIWEEELASARAAEAQPADPAQRPAARDRPAATLASAG